MSRQKSLYKQAFRKKTLANTNYSKATSLSPPVIGNYQHLSNEQTLGKAYGSASSFFGYGEIKPPTIYIFTDETPIGSFSSTKYGQPAISRAEMLKIASHAEGIYKKNKKDGMHLGVKVEVISSRQHKALRNSSKYRAMDAWVEIFERGGAGKSELEIVDGQLQTDIGYATLNRNEQHSIYRTGHMVAHEALHQLIAKAVFYTMGAESYRKYREKKVFRNARGVVLSDDKGHYNGLETADGSGWEANLNMDAKQLQGAPAFAVDRPSKKLRANERIVPQHMNLLQDLIVRETWLRKAKPGSLGRSFRPNWRR